MDPSWLDAFFGRTLAEPDEHAEGTRAAALAKARNAAALSQVMQQTDGAEAELYERESAAAFLSSIAAATSAAPADLVDAVMADAAANLPAPERRAGWFDRITAILPRPAYAGWIGGALASGALAFVLVIGEFRETAPPVSEPVKIDSGEFDAGPSAQPAGSGGGIPLVMPIPAQPVAPPPIPPPIVLPGITPPPPAAPKIVPPANALQELLNPEAADLPAAGPRASGSRRGVVASPQTADNGCKDAGRAATAQAENGTAHTAPPPNCPPSAVPGTTVPTVLPAIPANPPGLDLPLASAPLPQ